MSPLLVFLALQLQIPAPTGYVNDFAGIVDARSRDVMLGAINEVKTKSGGEIVVVTLRSLDGRASINVARDIIREWKIGAKPAPGFRAGNAGVVLLLVPGDHPGDGKADIAIGTGTGAEGFVTDALAGRIRDAIGQRAVETQSYAEGMALGTQLIALAYAREFGFELSGASAPEPEAERPARERRGLPVPLFIALIIIWIIIRSRSRRRGGGLGWFVLGQVLGSSGRGRGGWGGGGGFGGGGGGFGGFGGGGGGMGGGASGKF
jgi:uncharacterized protein